MNEHTCNLFWNIATISGTITILTKGRSNVSGTVSVRLCVSESITRLSIRFNHNVESPHVGVNTFNDESNEDNPSGESFTACFPLHPDIQALRIP